MRRGTTVSRTALLPGFPRNLPVVKAPGLTSDALPPEGLDVDVVNFHGRCHRFSQAVESKFSHFERYFPNGFVRTTTCLRLEHQTYVAGTGASPCSPCCRHCQCSQPLGSTCQYSGTLNIWRRQVRGNNQPGSPLKKVKAILYIFFGGGSVCKLGEV
jgi:hypothetical protein